MLSWPAPSKERCHAVIMCGILARIVRCVPQCALLIGIPLKLGPLTYVGFDLAEFGCGSSPAPLGRWAGTLKSVTKRPSLTTGCTRSTKLGVVQGGQRTKGQASDLDKKSCPVALRLGKNFSSSDRWFFGAVARGFRTPLLELNIVQLQEKLRRKNRFFRLCKNLFSRGELMRIPTNSKILQIADCR